MPRISELPRMLGVNAMIALAPVIPLSWQDTLPPWHTFLRLYGQALIFSNAIGLPAQIVYPPLWLYARRRNAVWKWTAIFATAAALAAAGAAIGCVVLALIGALPWNYYTRVYWSVLRTSLVITFTFGGLVCIFETLRHRLHFTSLELKKQQLERERAQKLAAEARLASLESRVHPHFLFNTLNSIAALIRDDPQRAETLVERLSQLLRFSLDAENEGLVTLRDELQIVRGYLEIESARFGDRLRFSIEAQEEALGGEVPPLAVQTLVENSVKHAVAPRREGGVIGVRAGRQDGRCVIEVTDDGPGFSIEDLRTGHGLDLLQSRLLTLCGRDAGLEIGRSGGRTRVVLSIPAQSPRRQP